MASSGQQNSYIDYDTFLADDFSATAFANGLVTHTNNASDTVVDLSTPLSKVLFDVQEIDTSLHSLTTGSAAALLEHARGQTASAQTVLAAVEAHVARLTARYAQLDTDVVQRHAVAEEVRLAASRLWVTVKIGRAVQRALLLGRQLDANMEDAFRAGARPPSSSGTTAGSGTGAAGTAAGAATIPSGSDEAAAIVRAAHSVLALKALLQASGPGEEGEHLGRINVIATLRTDLLSPAEQRLRARSQQVIREFSLSSLSTTASSDTAPSTLSSRGATSTSASSASSTSATAAPTPTTFAQSAAARSRTAAAAQALYLLSPAPASGRARDFMPNLLIAALEAYLRAALTASANGLARALAALSTLPRALAEVAARCQNVAALERLLADVRPPTHALLRSTEASSGTGNGAATSTGTETVDPALPPTLLHPLLDALDTRSLPSYFWRSLAGDVGARVTDLLNRGGVGARQLRASREKLRDLLREAVLRGCEGARDPTGAVESKVPPKDKVDSRKRWEREVQVMVGSVVGPLGR